MTYTREDHENTERLIDETTRKLAERAERANRMETLRCKANDEHDSENCTSEASWVVEFGPRPTDCVCADGNSGVKIVCTHHLAVHGRKLSKDHVTCVGCGEPYDYKDRLIRIEKL